MCYFNGVCEFWESLLRRVWSRCGRGWTHAHRSLVCVCVCVTGTQNSYSALPCDFEQSSSPPPPPSKLQPLVPRAVTAAAFYRFPGEIKQHRVLNQRWHACSSAGCLVAGRKMKIPGHLLACHVRSFSVRCLTCGQGWDEFRGRSQWRFSSRGQMNRSEL